MKNVLKHTLVVVLTALTFLAFNSCRKPKDELTIYSFTGKAQKGPYVSGTEINLYELNQDLVQTGKAFSTTISANDGSFSLLNMELGSQYALLSANGFFFSEIYGNISSAQLNLQAVTDLTDQRHVNINVLTHVTAPRIITLVGAGKTYAEAREQAEKEMLAFLGVTENIGKGFDQTDISATGDLNGMLLSFSLMLQHYTSSLPEQPQFVAQLTQLLADVTTDFTSDGIIDNQSIISKLLENAAAIKRDEVRAKLADYYTSLGLQVEIPDFETYLALFQEKYDPNFITDFYYPEEASPLPEIDPEGKLPNVLVKEKTQFTTGSYVVAAAVPLGKKLKIRIITESQAGPSQPSYGWDVTHGQGEYILESNRENEVIAALFYIHNFASTPGEATIEYYEDSETPTFSKKITW